MTPQTIEVSKRPTYTNKQGQVISADKVNSVVFVAPKSTEPQIIGSVYLNRPFANGHTKARITVEFLD
jgi:hypothetical protein